MAQQFNLDKTLNRRQTFVWRSCRLDIEKEQTETRRGMRQLHGYAVIATIRTDQKKKKTKSNNNNNNNKVLIKNSRKRKRVEEQKEGEKMKKK